MEQNRNPLFTWDEKLTLLQAMPMSLQHVFAMIVGNITPAILIAGAAKLPADEKVLLIQTSLLIAAFTTLLMVYSIKGFAGAKLPVIMGVSFSYLPTMMGIVNDFDIATIFGAQLVGAFAAVLFGFSIKYVLKYFPPLVTGTVVLSIGLSLYPIAINYMAGGLGSPTYGSYKNWLVAIITLVAVFIFTHYTKGITKLAAILCGMIVGYIVAAMFGMISYDNVAAAGWFQVPKPLHFGVKFEVSTMIAMLIMFVVNSVQAIGDLTATTVGGMDRTPTDKELSNGIIGYGIANAIGAVFGGLPTATYSQNVGIVSVTKVINKKVFGFAAAIILVAGLIPKFSSILTTIPACVLGGATISVFAIITMNGIRLITKDGFSGRDAAVVGLAIALGIGLTQTPAAIESFPLWFKTVFGRNAVVISTLIALTLNLILPKDQQK